MVMAKKDEKRDNSIVKPTEEETVRSEVIILGNEKKKKCKVRWAKGNRDNEKKVKGQRKKEYSQFRFTV